MLIAQITDLHLGFQPDTPDELNRLRLDQTLRALTSMTARPDLLIATGDLSDQGTVSSYRALKDAFAACPIPILLCVGNHDRREGLLEVFPETPTDDGFVQYVVEGHPLRIVVLDTLEDGRHGGAFCERRAAWLEARLAEAPDRPTLLVLHHPPMPTGIEWMTTDPEEPWSQRLGAVMRRHPQIVSAICGHIHRPLVSPFAGALVAVCPSTAPQVVLDLAPIDPERPDNRPLIVEGPAAFALHRWTGTALITHFAVAEPHPVLARYTPGFQPFLQSLFVERAERD